MTSLLQQLEKRQFKQDSIPEYRTGDTVEVKMQIEEGNRIRTQAFEGVVIKKRARGISSSLTLRKVTNGSGVERTFNIHSPLVKSIVVKRLGLVRRANISYIRGLSAKKARIPERHIKRNTAKKTTKN